MSIRFCSVVFQMGSYRFDQASWSSPVWIAFTHGVIEVETDASSDAFGLNTLNASQPGQLAAIGFERLPKGLRLYGFATLDEGLRQVQVDFDATPFNGKYLGILRILSQSSFG